MKVGTKAALIAPSANRSLIRLGILVATLKASMALPAPKRYARTWSRMRPSTRLVSVALPIIPADLARCEEAEPSPSFDDSTADEAVSRRVTGNSA